ncbi:MAG TPA: 3D domain-containing protein [Spirochaetota bacterium]|nr:3D domain-containing protein [Spirochaetota bacterium]HOT20733.1 3D domain-containing protein [Spirochaetota bacterium]HPD06091.1 3D domain-containing protein [Spirochaetota bacterium]HQG43768.1 3D domain-containing protein [Spirochaetota bacterium]HRR61687.1 3D domain-containing protein [Spirochaetota bacterium]
MKRLFIGMLFIGGLALMAFTYHNDILLRQEPWIELSNTQEKYKGVTWKITAYCPGSCCNKRITGTKVVDYTNSAAIGGLKLTTLLDNTINVVAVDRSIIPLGSIVKYNNNYYVALDTGSAIKGFTLDILMPHHKQTEKFGIQYSDNIEVYIPHNPAQIIKKIKKIALEYSNP